VISQRKDIGDLTAKDIGDLTTKRYWWSHNQKILVIPQPKDIDDLTAKDIGDLTAKDIGDLTAKSESHCSESVSAVILRGTVSKLIPLCVRHSSTVRTV